MFRPICLPLSGLPCVVETLTQKSTIPSPCCEEEGTSSCSARLAYWLTDLNRVLHHIRCDVFVCINVWIGFFFFLFWPLGLSYWSRIQMLMISHHSCGRLKDGLLTLCCRVLHNAVYLLCTVGELLTLSVFNAALTGSDTGAVGHSEIGNRLSWIRLLWRRQFHIPLLCAVCMSLCGPLKKKEKESSN